ncbi:Glyoxalase/Bleomycin resistance protein/Dihydroxybiphenyl dioxygenase [Microdochium trichocladiopsis]|uniref:Glyoxalase/Bleomycin resistance protein/Dihydroxybiphenyl dioxygenase n=1 Tax=Microdochium trichocladiopsis TaxID=1682393 RepID=A0A9P9BIR2_9PEZI|nr:Glyoxalase/Bleomycin resistance protein/Dihydroxybiphenyl dioxygenase [Microdochium trichocladiopsis]KAH7024518.1 Glyoxalase/Bleomycin resistance protein/Dihydroxybiphenyl dioxygenase [Microdochium trichocladiopsis]
MSSLPMTLLLSVVSKMPKPIRDSVEMRIPDITNDASKVQLLRPSHVYVEHPNLDQFAKFAADFGLVEASRSRTGDTIYFRGYGRDPYCYVATKSRDSVPRFKGGAFVARSREDFDKAARMPGATLGSLTYCPGGGEIVTFTRPDNTFFHVVYGQKEREPDHHTQGTGADDYNAGETVHEPSAITESLGPFNTPFSKPRKGKFQRFHPGPALVHKLGHFGYVFPDFDAELAWYTGNFNFVPSDVLHHWDFANIDVMAFMHLDHLDHKDQQRQQQQQQPGAGKGEIESAEDESWWSDHHCFFLQRAEPHVTKAFCHHTSFEVSDVDTQLVGHEYLASKGWHSVWGVGRHVLGSQIFDYWADPSGFKIEHYADGDLVGKGTPTKREVVGPFAVWGPEMPSDFGDKFPEAFLSKMRGSGDGSAGGFLSRWWWSGSQA